MSATLTRRWLGGRSHARPIGLPLLVSVTEVGARTGDVEFVRQYHEDREDRRREQEATKFREQNPNYFRSEKNYERLSSYLDQHNMEFTAENLARAFRALRSSGHLQFDVNKPQPLTTEQLIYVARLAARGDLENATLNYISYSLPNWNRYTDPTSDPRPEIQQVMTDCAWFIFKNMTPQFKDGPDVRQFMEEHVGDRPTTVGLLQVAFKLCQEQQQGELHSQLLEETREPSVEEQNLDDLSDAEIAALFQGATREHVRREIRGNRNNVS